MSTIGSRAIASQVNHAIALIRRDPSAIFIFRQFPDLPAPQVLKFGEGAVEAAQGTIHKLAWKRSHATQQYQALFFQGLFGLVSLKSCIVLE